VTETCAEVTAMQRPDVTATMTVDDAVARFRAGSTPWWLLAASVAAIADALLVPAHRLSFAALGFAVTLAIGLIFTWSPLFPASLRFGTRFNRQK